MPALAHADMAFSQGAIYAQRYGTSKGPETGYTAGLSLVVDWSFTENKTSSFLGLGTEIQVGAGAFNSDIALDWSPTFWGCSAATS